MKAQSQEESGRAFASAAAMVAAAAQQQWPRLQWDATFNGVAVPNGTYFYVLNNRLNGQQLAQGYVTIHQ